MSAIDYNAANWIGATLNPSGIVSASPMVAYFEKYLLQKLKSVYEWKIPETWDINYLTDAIYLLGCVAVFETDRFGVIPQHCTLSGYNVFYQPARAIVNNPLLPGINDLEIGERCEIIKMQPGYCGAYDIIHTYAVMMAEALEAVCANLYNSRFAYVFACKDDKQAASFKKMFGDITAGHPAVFADRKLFDDEGNQTWQYFNKDVASTYIAGDILDDLQKIEDRFKTAIGIVTANTEKRERLVVDEVHARDEDTKALCRLWLDTMNAGCEKVNRRYGLDISVAFRDDIEGEGL